MATRKKRSATEQRDRTVRPCPVETARAPGTGAPVRFVPERQLGSGGLCEVYSAKDLLRLEHDDGLPQVALKRLLPRYEQNPVARRLLAREFFIARHISHPGVVRVFDLHEERGRLCLSMEMLTGRTLYSLLERHPAGMGPSALPLARRLLGTLAMLHGLGIAHGDIKPANLSLENEDRLVLFDFNTAEVSDRPGQVSSRISQSLRTNLGLSACSLLHASPERLEGHPPSFADDIFAACCTIAELLEGRHPFARRTALEARDARMPPPRLSMGKTPEGKMLLRGLSFDPALRPTARELEEAFRPSGFAVRCFSALYTSLIAKES